jgi:hypothetical protein
VPELVGLATGEVDVADVADVVTFVGVADDTGGEETGFVLVRGCMEEAVVFVETLALVEAVPGTHCE